MSCLRMSGLSAAARALRSYSWMLRGVLCLPGRVPGHFCGCVGIKPTVGRFSTTGVVQACRALDCISIFARCVEDGAEVARLMQASHQPQLSPLTCRHAHDFAGC